jgi:hypothetical protein
LHTLVAMPLWEPLDSSIELKSNEILNLNSTRLLSQGEVWKKIRIPGSFPETQTGKKPLGFND